MLERKGRLVPERWAEYLEGFHTERAGITEEVLSRAVAGQQNPYRWLARAVSARADLVLDVACGSGAMGRELESESRTVVSLDLSEQELREAKRRSPGPFVQADALTMPFANDTFDAITSSMGLAVIRPIGPLLTEIARVLKPGGVFAAMMPTIRPLRPSDIYIGARIAAILRTTPRFPGSLEVTIDPLLLAAGLRRVENARQRYHYPVRTREDAEVLIASLYLPKTKTQRFRDAVDFLTEQADSDGVIDVPIAMRRIIAIK